MQLNMLQKLTKDANEWLIWTNNNFFIVDQKLYLLRQYAAKYASKTRQKSQKTADLDNNKFFIVHGKLYLFRVEISIWRPKRFYSPINWKYAV